MAALDVHVLEFIVKQPAKVVNRRNVFVKHLVNAELGLVNARVELSHDHGDVIWVLGHQGHPSSEQVSQAKAVYFEEGALVHHVQLAEVLELISPGKELGVLRGHIAIIHVEVDYQHVR